MNISNLTELINFSTRERSQSNKDLEIYRYDDIVINVETWINFVRYINLNIYYKNIAPPVHMFGTIVIFKDIDQTNGQDLIKKMFTKNLIIGGNFTLQNFGYIKIPKSFICNGRIRCEKTYLLDIPNNLYGARGISFTAGMTTSHNKSYVYKEIENYYYNYISTLQDRLNVDFNTQIFPSIYIKSI